MGFTWSDFVKPHPDRLLAVNHNASGYTGKLQRRMQRCRLIGSKR
ncbi:hypothetical protein HMPREF9374_1950 [Desmospora sp. 8437]|nr:hypothetical protein HMPREF9374_1950 [Desmospora sp. 8437]